MSKDKQGTCDCDCDAGYYRLHQDYLGFNAPRYPTDQVSRSPLDIALAMQLRPGLGVGADPAWMVRFLMSMFGWFAILVSGQGEF